MKKLLLISGTISLLIINPVLAYNDDYPPYKFKDGAFSSLEADPLISYDNEEYQSEDGSVVAVLRGTNDGLDFMVKDDGFIVARKTDRKLPDPFAVYHVDLDKNGLKDFIHILNLQF